MADYKVTDTQLSSIANAIRTKGGTSATLVFPSGFVSAVENIPTGGGVLVSKTISQNGSYRAADDNADGYSDVIVNVAGGSSPVLISKSISQNGIYNPSDDNADAYSQVVVNVQGGGGDSDSNFLIAIGASGGSIYDTKASVVGSFAFYRRTRSVVNAMTGIEMTNASIVLESAFGGCISHFTHASFPMCTKISSYAFTGCTGLQEIYFPVCTIIDFEAFSNCKNLTSASFPLCEYISGYAFESAGVISLCFPRCTSIYSAAFLNCRSLKTITLPVCSLIGTSAFSSCYALESAYFLSSSVVKLSNYAFNNTPMSKSTYLGYFGSIYVPASLVESYKSASNWSVYSDRITSYVEE